jgi:transposase
VAHPPEISHLTAGTRTAGAIDYSLKRWDALTRYLDDGEVPIDNNWIENQVRPWALAGKTGCLLDY